MFEISSLRFADLLGSAAAADQLITVRPLTRPQQIRSGSRSDLQISRSSSKLLIGRSADPDSGSTSQLLLRTGPTEH